MHATPALTPELDALLDSEEIMENPYAVYARLRDEAPVAWSDRWRAWVVSRYDDVAVSLKDRENLSNENRQGLLFSEMTDKEREDLAYLRHYFAQKDVIGSDPPDHTRLRALVQKAFTPKTMASLEPRIRALATDLLRDAAKKPTFDFVADVAHPMPVILIAELLGAAPDDRHLFKKWSSEILAFQGTGRAVYAVSMRSQKSLKEMFDYVNRLVELRRQKPEDDLITSLSQVEEAGRGFTRDELLATCNTLLTAGHETTTNLIGNLVHLLFSHPEQAALVRENPALIGGAIEESLRFDAPKQRNFRRIKKSYIFRDCSFEENQMVFQLIGSANRDPQKFPDPDKFDVTRKENDHLSFGSGIHFCLGAPLARLEARVVLETLFNLMPSVRLAARTMPWQERAQFRGPQELWLESCLSTNA
jgi:cytochrome P450